MALNLSMYLCSLEQLSYKILCEKGPQDCFEWCLLFRCLLKCTSSPRLTLLRLLRRESKLFCCVFTEVNPQGKARKPRPHGMGL